MKLQVIAIVGPTAVGKSELGIEIALRFNGEVISGDSMQIYKGMDIGTAKVTKDEMKGVPHHMIDIKEPDESFSVAEFKVEAQKHITDIHKRGKIPIIVGGSGLYISATLYDYQFTEQKRDPKFVQALEEKIKQEGIMPLYKRLQQIDPIQAQKIHPNNHRRIIRALEIYHTTGQTKSSIEKQQPTTSPYAPIFIGLTMEREQLYRIINERIDRMIEQGLVKEVRKFYDMGLKDHQSMRAIGYKEFIPYIKGKQTLEEAIEILKRNSRRYAKRQYTWFRNQLKIPWYSVDPDDPKKHFENIFQDLAGFLTEK